MPVQNMIILTKARKLCQWSTCSNRVLNREAGGGKERGGEQKGGKNVMSQLCSTAGPQADPLTFIHNGIQDALLLKKNKKTINLMYG